jgi:hypothetical protein
LFLQECVDKCISYKDEHQNPCYITTQSSTRQDKSSTQDKHLKNPCHMTTQSSTQDKHLNNPCHMTTQSSTRQDKSSGLVYVHNNSFNGSHKLITSSQKIDKVYSFICNVLAVWVFLFWKVP